MISMRASNEAWVLHREDLYTTQDGHCNLYLLLDGYSNIYFGQTLRIDLPSISEISELLNKAKIKMVPGCYALTGFTPEAEKAVLNGFCMNQLYPYACAEVSHLAAQGGFGMIYLQPIDFIQQYKEQQSEAALETIAAFN
jgi:preprotein translocase subunit SecB